MQLSEAYERGAVLAFYFADQLKGLEDSGFDIAGSLRDIILSLDPSKEASRPAQFAPVRQRLMLARETARNRKLELPKRLMDVNELIKNKKFVEADAMLRKLLEDNPDESRIYYNLGRVSSILAQPDITFDESLRDKRLDDAKAHYSNAIRTANKETDPALVQLSYLALGRIYEFYDENETAIKVYDAAIKIGAVEGGAYREAMAAKANLAKKP
jgi:tetratricopeptide (TPR) repeat protein